VIAAGGLLLALTLPGQAPSSEAPAPSAEQRYRVYEEARKLLDAEHLGLNPSWSPKDAPWGWYAKRPSRRGDRDLVSFHHRRSHEPGGEGFYARRVRFSRADVTGATELERTLPKAIDLPGIGPGDESAAPKSVTAVADGTDVVLQLRGLGEFGSMTFQMRHGPLHNWVMRFSDDTGGCWRPEPAS
jgi:hypothetical protein